MSRFHLSDRATLFVKGEEATEFLANLITCALPDKGALHFGALLTPQGKILFEFFVLGLDDGYLLDCLANERDALLKRLMFYRLRAKVDLAPSDLNVFGSFVDENSGHKDPRHGDMGWRIYDDGIGEQDSAYHSRRIAAGLAELGYDFDASAVFPHEVSMDFTTGVDFQKGCYVGQEVVSRMQHRGTARSRFVIINGEENLPTMGTSILAGEKTIGTMGSSVSSQGLALMRLDRLTTALDIGTPITAEGQAVTFTAPPLDGFPWPV